MTASWNIVIIPVLQTRKWRHRAFICCPGLHCQYVADPAVNYIPNCCTRLKLSLSHNKMKITVFKAIVLWDHEFQEVLGKTWDDPKRIWILTASYQTSNPLETVLDIGNKPWKDSLSLDSGRYHHCRQSLEESENTLNDIGLKEYSFFTVPCT